MTTVSKFLQVLGMIAGIILMIAAFLESGDIAHWHFVEGALIFLIGKIE